MIKEKVIKNLLLLAVGVAKESRVSMKCPKSRFPIQIIEFGEPELIIFVSQGLTLSTASLVGFYQPNHTYFFGGDIRECFRSKIQANTADLSSYFQCYITPLKKPLGI